MKLKEKIKKEYEGVVSIDTLRSLLKKLIKDEVEQLCFVDDSMLEKVEYIVESIVLNNYIDSRLEDIEIENIKTHIKVACKALFFDNGYIELQKKSLNDVLWSAVFQHVEFNYFCDLEGKEELIDCSPHLNHVLDIEMAIESGRIPDSGYDTISTRELVDSITEIITYYFKDKVEK